jgi:hypothetical protein
MNTQQENYNNVIAIENALTLMNMSIYQTCNYCRHVYNNALIFMNEHRNSQSNLQIDVNLRVSNDNAIHLVSVTIRDFSHVLYEVSERDYRRSQ